MLAFTHRSSRRVLLLEENESVRSLMGQLLEHAGYRVLASGHPLDPLDVDQLRPDVLLMDIVFRDNYTGWAYLRQLRAHPRTARLPVLVCTAEYEQVRAATCEELSLANALILKPLDAEELLDTVRSILTPVPSLTIVPSTVPFGDWHNIAES